MSKEEIRKWNEWQIVVGAEEIRTRVKRKSENGMNGK